MFQAAIPHELLNSNMINVYISYMNVSSSIICTCTLVMVLAILHARCFFYVTRHAALFGGNVTALIECRSLNEFFLFANAEIGGCMAGIWKTMVLHRTKYSLLYLNSTELRSRLYWNIQYHVFRCLRGKIGISKKMISIRNNQYQFKNLWFDPPTNDLPDSRLVQEPLHHRRCLDI